MTDTFPRAKFDTLTAVPFKTTLGRAIDCASIVRVNDFEIDEFVQQGQEHVLGCSGVTLFKVIEQDVLINDEGQAFLSGYLQTEVADHPSWTPAALRLEFRVSHPLTFADTE